jgi:Ca2+-binding RTX toxin-like protein
VGSAAETVHGGTGNDTIEVTSSTIGASIDGGSGQSTLEVTGGGSTVMGSNVVDISTILLESAPGNLSFIANATSGLLVDDLSSGADMVQAGGANQTLEGGAGHDTFVGFSGGTTTFENLAAAMNGATISNFAAPNDVLFLTNVNFATLTKNFVENGSNTAGALTVSDGTHSASITLDGLFSANNFHTAADGAGTAITYH